MKTHHTTRPNSKRYRHFVDKRERKVGFRPLTDHGKMSLAESMVRKPKGYGSQDVLEAALRAFDIPDKNSKDKACK